MNEPESTLPVVERGNSETDSFDEIKTDPIGMEPVFSTASGLRIDVKIESLEKTKQLFENNGHPSESKPFSSPIVRKNDAPKQFVSPFRNTELKQNTFCSPLRTTKRRGEINDELVMGKPPNKRDTTFQTSIDKPNGIEEVSLETFVDLSGTVQRVEDLPELSERRFILEDNEHNHILVRCSLSECPKIQLFDNIKLTNARVIWKNRLDSKVEEVKGDIIVVTRNGSVGTEYSFAKKPFIREPMFIHELCKMTPNQIAVLKVNIVDFGPKFYKGCRKCKYRFNSSRHPERCPKCGEYVNADRCIYSLMRVVDFSGQIQLHVPHDVMRKFLEMLGYMDQSEMDKFSNLQEQMAYIFKPVMVRLEWRNGEYTALEFSEVHWNSYSQAMERKSANMLGDHKMADKIVLDS